MAAALKSNVECPEAKEQWTACPSMLTTEEIVVDMCEGQYADQYRNATSKAKLPPQLWFVDFVLQRNVCPLGHKDAETRSFLTALYSFHKGYWCSIPEIIWRQLHKFQEGVHQRATEGRKNWGLPFPFLITYMLRKKGIKGTSADGPITEHPQFGRIQWNQSYSHMPRGLRARAVDEPVPMDMDEVVEAEYKVAVEPEAAEERVVGQEDMITISTTDYRAMQQTLADIRFELVVMWRDERQDKLEANERYHAQQTVL